MLNENQIRYNVAIPFTRFYVLPIIHRSRLASSDHIKRKWSASQTTDESRKGKLLPWNHYIIRNSRAAARCNGRIPELAIGKEVALLDALCVLLYALVAIACHQKHRK